MTRDEYLRFRRPYQRALQQLRLELKFFLQDVRGINVHEVSSRLKSYKSATRKCRPNLPIADMQDIAGLRIVAATTTEVDTIARFFSRKADSKDLAITTDERIARPDGYRARHLVVEFDGHYTRSMYPTRVEVQLQTIMQSAFNFISRAWVYKRDLCFPKPWGKEFRQVSAVLARLDARITKLQTEVLDSSARSGPNEPLTPFSYQRIVAEVFSEMVELNNAVDSVRFLIDVQCDTNSKLRAFLGREDILDLRNRFLKLGSEKEQSVVQIVTEMPTHEFFLTFGVRIEATEHLLQSLKGT
jgi:ppGpp synthetase/RelA/SpoT-type nucleotidyltranferase